MAEALVSALLKNLAPRMIQEFGFAWDAIKDLRKLETTFLTIKDVLEDAESQSMKNKPLFNWLAKLEDATYDMEDLLDYVKMETERRKLEIHGHIIKEVCCFFSCSNPIIFRFKISCRVKEMRERLDEISANRSKFNLKKREANDRKMEIEEGRETWSLLDEKSIYGRDGDIERIVSFLLETNNEEEHVLILPIVGMGGMGKTTLAQLVYNDERVQRNEQFELRSWVYVSEVFNPKKIMKDILSATEQSCNQDNLESIGNKLKNLLREKKFLLVLDDVSNENENEWKKLKPIFNVGKRGSRIIVTTRSGKIALLMGNTTTYNLKELSDEDCWKLFKQRAFGNESGKENSNLVQIGREIVKKCGGVPLAANALGSTLRFKKEEDDWLAVRDSDIWKVTKEGDDVLASLRLSYTNLLSPAKQCFAYCSLFPKGYEFDKEILISQWIAQGFVWPVDGSPPMEIIENTYFNDLLLMSFLQKIENDYENVRYKLHDLIHDLVEFVAGDKVLVEKTKKSVTGLKMGCRYLALMGTSTIVPANSLKKIRALHVFDNDDEFPKTILSSAKCLRTLDLSEYGKIKSLPKLSNLRYIRVSIQQVEMLPEYICGLRNLQFVYLSDCRSLRTIPESIGNLCNLRNLKLIGCGSELEPFPDSFGNLEHLVSLDLSKSQIELLPIKFFDRLQNLQSINLSRCEILKELPDSIGDAKSLRSLNMYWCFCLRALPESTSNLTHLESLNLGCCVELHELPKDLGKMRSLKHLNIGGCDGLRGMPRGMRQMTNLETLPLFVVGKEEGGGFASIGELEHLNHIEGRLKIRNVERVRNRSDATKANLKEKRKLHYLVLLWREKDGGDEIEEGDDEIEEGVLECLQPPPSIKTLDIWRYGGRKIPSWLASSASLPNLAKLTLWGMKRIVSLPAAVLPSLTELKFINNSNLEEWTTEEATTLFPRLKTLEIKWCPKLKARPCIPASVEELIIWDDSRDDELLSDTSLQSSSRLRTLEMGGTSSANVQWMGLRHLASSLQELRIEDCSEVRCLPESIRHLASLRDLTLSHCKKLLEIGEWVGKLQSLRSLCIEKCPGLTSLPNGMRHLALHDLTIDDCLGLKEIGEWVGELQSLRYLWIYSCPGLTSLPNGMRHLALDRLFIDDCPGLKEIGEWVGELQSLRYLSIKRCPGLTSLPNGMRHLALDRLSIGDCPGLKEIPEWVGELQSLRSLYINSCHGLTSLPNGMRHLALEHLYISDCPRLTERCERERGEDWHLISHIPNISVSWW